MGELDPLVIAHEKYALDNSTSFLIEEIHKAAMPTNFKMPVITPYKGKTNPLEHVSAFNNNMHLTYMTGHASFKCFLITLAKRNKEMILEASPKQHLLLDVTIKGIHQAVSICSHICNSLYHSSQIK